MSGNAESVERVSSACSASHPTMAQLPSSSASTINKNYCLRQPRRPLPRELLNELLICLPRHRCRFSELLSTSSIVYNLLFRNKSFRRWRQQVARKKAALIQSAKAAYKGNFHEGVIESMKGVIEMGAELNFEEHNLLCVGNEKYYLARQAELELLVGAEELRKRLERKLRDHCTEMLSLFDNYLIPRADNSTIKLYCMQEKCKWYARLANIFTGDERSGILEKLHKGYQDAFEFASDQASVHPMRMELVTSFSEFYHECPHLPNNEARELIEQAMNVVNLASDAIMTLKQKLQARLDKLESADAAGVEQQV